MRHPVRPVEPVAESPADERDALAARYARRGAADAGRYSLLRPEMQQAMNERQRVMLGLLARHGFTDLTALRLTEVGSGGGYNLTELLRWGFAPEHLTGIELLPGRHREARHRLPAAVTLLEGDATEAAVPAASQDLVLQSTVFSSLLDDAFQQRLAAAMWRWLAPGGAVLWYDFTVDNPRNPDVRGVPAARVRALFPQAASFEAHRVTLAPPLARAVARGPRGLVRPVLGLLSALPPLRTHLVAWIAKGA